MFKPRATANIIFGSNIFKEPKLQHYIAEHAHPSLSDSCTKLENTMAKFEMALRNISDLHGNRFTKEPTSAWNVATVVDNNFSSLACIARANRSYCIGLKNADIEVIFFIFYLLFWTQIQLTNAYCMKANEQSREICDETLNGINIIIFKLLQNHFSVGLLSSKNRITEVGSVMLESGGYCLETPIEKNWWYRLCISLSIQAIDSKIRNF